MLPGLSSIVAAVQAKKFVAESAKMDSNQTFHKEGFESIRRVVMTYILPLLDNDSQYEDFVVSGRKLCPVIVCLAPMLWRFVAELDAFSGLEGASEAKQVVGIRDRFAVYQREYHNWHRPKCFDNSFECLDACFDEVCQAIESIQDTVMQGSTKKFHMVVDQAMEFIKLDRVQTLLCPSVVDEASTKDSFDNLCKTEDMQKFAKAYLESGALLQTHQNVASILGKVANEELLKSRQPLHDAFDVFTSYQVLFRVLKGDETRERLILDAVTVVRFIRLPPAVRTAMLKAAPSIPATITPSCAEPQVLAPA